MADANDGITARPDSSAEEGITTQPYPPSSSLGKDDDLAGSLCESLKHSVGRSLVYQSARKVLVAVCTRGRRLAGGPIRIGS